MISLSARRLFLFFFFLTSLPSRIFSGLVFLLGGGGGGNLGGTMSSDLFPQHTYIKKRCPAFYGWDSFLWRASIFQRGATAVCGSIGLPRRW